MSFLVSRYRHMLNSFQGQLGQELVYVSVGSIIKTPILICKKCLSLSIVV